MTSPLSKILHNYVLRFFLFALQELDSGESAFQNPRSLLFSIYSHNGTRIIKANVKFRGLRHDLELLVIDSIFLYDVHYNILNLSMLSPTFTFWYVWIIADQYWTPRIDPVGSTYEKHAAIFLYTSYCLVTIRSCVANTTETSFCPTRWPVVFLCKFDNHHEKTELIFPNIGRVITVHTYVEQLVALNQQK